MEDKPMKKVKKQLLFRQMIGLFSLLFVVVPFSLARDGSVKFTVTIKNGGTCQVHSGYENQQVALGTVYANELSTANQTAGEKDFDLWVEDCGDLISETNKLKFVLMNTTNFNLLAKGVLPNLETGANKDSVGVQLLTKKNNPVEIKYNALQLPYEGLVSSPNGDTLGAEDVAGQAHAFKLPLKARFYAITDGKGDKAGDVRAEVIFAAFYE
ncbi:type 1 fimbrial protein [Haemophilus influenzae biotype aegyptius]|uniref:Fimbrial protein n=2 Tax=Haemophilus influenzae TaxID=727 RepID=A0AAV2U3T1_HAEIF|nr:type 1 fimbrial protein [Haemophilus influenzae biotype aegyptius]CBY86872.1 Fimbrial protein [Haemophilus influenzae F3047]